MNTLKTTMSKIAQIEQPERTDLAKHEIELALVDDLNKGVTEAFKQEANYYSDFKLELNKIIDTARKIEVKYNVLASNINEPIFQMEKQAKELGLDIKGTPNYKKAMDALKAIETRKDAISSIVENIRKFGF